MLNQTFPEYSIKYSELARKTRLALSPALRRVADEIEVELSSDPNKYPERLSPGSMAGTSRIYEHPEPKLTVLFEVDEDKKILYLFHYSAPTVQPLQTIFISYSHQDKEWLEKLRVFLTVLEQQGVIKFWDDSQIEPGLPWNKQITDVLNAAKAGLLLVSQDFLASKFIKDVELPRLLHNAIKAGKRIYWLHLSPSTVFETHPEITEYQSILEDPKTSLEELDVVAQKKALVQLTKKLKEGAEIS